MRDANGAMVEPGDVVQFNEEPPNEELHRRFGELVESTGEMSGVVEFLSAPAPRPAHGGRAMPTRCIALSCEILRVGRLPLQRVDVTYYSGRTGASGDYYADHYGPPGDPPASRPSKPSALDRRRLMDVAEALALPEAGTRAEAEAQLVRVAAACAAGQSTDDLGSPAANEAAACDLELLMAKWDRLKKLAKARGRARK